MDPSGDALTARFRGIHALDKVVIVIFCEVPQWLGNGTRPQGLMRRYTCSESEQVVRHSPSTLPRWGQTPPSVEVRPPPANPSEPSSPPSVHPQVPSPLGASVPSTMNKGSQTQRLQLSGRLRITWVARTKGPSASWLLVSGSHCL